MSALTDKQSEVLAFIKNHIATYGFPPTLREIAQHFCWQSENSAATHVNALRDKGYIRIFRGLSRGIRVASQETDISESQLAIIAINHAVDVDTVRSILRAAGAL